MTDCIPRVVRVYRGAAFFASRAAARAICAEIDALPPGEPATADWSGIDAVTGAFADEYVKWMLACPRAVSNEGMSDGVLEAFALARLRNGRRYPVAEIPDEAVTLAMAARARALAGLPDPMVLSERELARIMLEAAMPALAAALEREMRDKLAASLRRSLLAPERNEPSAWGGMSRDHDTGG